MHFVLKIWLKIVPDYLLEFGRLTLVFNFFAILSLVVVSAIHATGKNKMPSLINGTLYLLVLPLSYFALKNGSSPVFPYLVNVIFVFIGLILNLNILKFHVKEFDIYVFFREVLFICLAITIITSIIPIFLHLKMEEGWIRFVLVMITSILSVVLFSYIIAIDRKLKMKVKEMIKSIFIK